MTKPLQFAPFNSALDAGFWHKLSQLKLDVYGLDDEPKPVKGFYFNGDPPGLVSRMNIDYTAFENDVQTPPRCFPSNGTLRNTNTMEDFRNCDKKALLEDEALQMWQDIVSGRALQDPSLLARFIVLTFADLKKYHYYYWFAFPALLAPETTTVIGEVNPIEKVFSQAQLTSFVSAYDAGCLPNHIGFFLARQDGDSVQVAQMKDFTKFAENGKVMLCVSDPCTLETNPGWPLRNLLTLAAYHWADVLDEVDVICFRDRTKDGHRDVTHSIVFRVKINSIKHLTECPKCVGWEKNERQKLGPRMVNLSSSMDPVRLAESAVDLNLKLMRWRLLPELDLKKVAETKCLLLGSGTLGCNVARGLLAWGVRNITLVDNGRISYSNPVRQSLFVFEDSQNGGKPKAQTAAEALKLIFPGVNAVGMTLSIPMPGHPITDNARQQTEEDVQKLESLIDEHDVVFLLMDTRESRWLPSLIGAAKYKIVINAALGFDTFLVVRHGVKQEPVDAEAGAVTMETDQCGMSVPFKTPIPGHLLGCYFCNDVVAPGDSTRDRTLDQQCTVSRPGMSMIASALAVELLVSILQHPLGGRAPADTSSQDEHLTKDSDSPLGLVPHQIRGFLSRYHQLMPASSAYSLCTACSSKVIDKYREDGFNFLLDAFNKPKYLEDLTGLTQLHADTVDAEVWELSDSEEDM